MTRNPAPAGGSGLAGLRRAGRSTEILFLYEITTRRRARLRAIADALGVTVQATSRLYRELSRRGWVEQVEGTYRPTVRGVEALHAALSELRDDLDRRLDHLRIVRRTWAIATRAVSKGEPLALSMEEGLLSASPAKGRDRSGTATHDAATGELVEVSDLRGIVPLRSATVRCLVVPSGPPRDLARWKGEVASEVRAGNHRLLVAEGLEAYHLLRTAARAPITRFGGAAAAREASQVGVPVLVVVTSERLAPLLEELSKPPASGQVEVRTLPAH